MEKIQNIREKIKRKLSIHDKNPNFDDSESVDEETQTRLEREMADAEEGDHPTGKPGSFLNRLISHGNKKTEDQLAADGFAERPAAAPAAAAPADPTAVASTEAAAGEVKQ